MMHSYSRFFYSVAEKVQVYDLVRLPKDQPLLCGEPFCAPPDETLAQVYVDLLRSLHQVWKTSVEKFIQQQQQILKIRTDEITNFHEMGAAKVDEIMDKCTKDLWPLLAFINGSIIENVMIGSHVKVLTDHGSHEGFVLGMTSIKTGHIKVCRFHDNTKKEYNYEG